MESWTEQKKHDSEFGQLRRKKSRFVSKLRKVSFFLHSSRGVNSRPPPLLRPQGPSPRLSAWGTQKRCSGGEPLAILWRFDQPGNQAPDQGRNYQRYSRCNAPGPQHKRAPRNHIINFFLNFKCRPTCFLKTFFKIQIFKNL